MSMRNAKVMVFVAIFYILATACWAADSSVMLHRVKKGETLKKIAKTSLAAKIVSEDAVHFVWSMTTDGIPE